MPIYEYQCGSCGHDFELLQRIGSGPPDACPDCGDDAVGKKVSMTSFQLKGTGWYVTDFKDGGKKADGKGKTGDGTTPSGADKAAATDSAGSGDKAAKGSGDAATTSGGSAAKGETGSGNTSSGGASTSTGGGSKGSSAAAP